MDVHKMLEQKRASWILQRQRRSLKICLMRIWAMQSWTITGNCVPVLAKLFSARENRIRT